MYNNIKKIHDFKLFSSCCVIMMSLLHNVKVVKDHWIKLDLTYINYVQLHIQLFACGWKLPTGLPPSTIWDICYCFFSMALVLWLKLTVDVYTSNTPVSLS